MPAGEKTEKDPTPSTSDSDEEKRWFIERVDLIIQDFIEVQESNYDAASNFTDDADHGLVYRRNTTWTVIAGIVAAATGLTQLGLFTLDILVGLLILLVTFGVTVTIGIEYVRKQIVSRWEEVEEQYDAANTWLLTLQNWFHGQTIYPSKISQETLELYYEFVNVAVVASDAAIIVTMRKILIELKRMKPTDPLPPGLQKLGEIIEQRYGQFKARRSELMDPKVFLGVEGMLSPFESRYQTELKAGKIT
jgi:hypothetical protein